MKDYLLFTLALTWLSVPMMGLCAPQSFKIMHNADSAVQISAINGNKQTLESVLPIQETIQAGLVN